MKQREQCCGCLGGRPQTVAPEPLREAMMRSGDCRFAKQVHITWAEDATMNEGKQCLQRDVTEVDVSRRGAGRTCLMFVVFIRRMMSTLQWSRPETNVSSQPTCCLSVTLPRRSVARKCCSSQVSLCHSTRCLVCNLNLARHRLSANSRDLLTPICG